MHVHTHHLAVFLCVRNDVVNGDLRRSTRRGRNGDDGHALMFCGRDALQGAHVRKFRVDNDDADCLCRVHGRAAADCDDAVRATLFESGNARLHILDGGIGLDLGINFVGNARNFQHIRDFLGHAEFEKIRIGADKRLFKSPALDFGRNFLNCALAVITRFIEYKTICHNNISLSSFICILLYHI